MLVLALQIAFDVDAAMATYRARTRATVECRGARPDDITICARRDADRYRVPLDTIDRDDPKNEAVRVERDRLLARTDNCHEMSPFLVGCGKAGVGVSTSRGVHLLGERPLAP